jgi:hypothetical protein
MAEKGAPSFVRYLSIFTNGLPRAAKFSESLYPPTLYPLYLIPFYFICLQMPPPATTFVSHPYKCPGV